MTDTAFYDRMATLATSLMDKFGTPATLRRVTVGKPDAEGKAVKTTTDTPALAVQINSKEVVDRLQLKGDSVYVVKAIGEPTEYGDLLIHGGKTMEIQDSKHVNPEGSRIMLSFHGVKRA